MMIATLLCLPIQPFSRYYTDLFFEMMIATATESRVFVELLDKPVTDFSANPFSSENPLRFA